MSNKPPSESPNHCRQLFEGLQAYQSELRQDMHDGICQTLTSALLMARTMACQPPEDTASAFHELGRLLAQAVENSRSLAYKLCPLTKEPGALMEALARLARSSSTPCEFVCEEPCLIRNTTRALAIYRLAEMAISLANEKKLSQLTLTLARAEQNGALVLSLSSPGFPPFENQPLLEALAIAAEATAPAHQAQGSWTWLIDSRPEHTKP